MEDFVIDCWIPDLAFKFWMMKIVVLKVIILKNFHNRYDHWNHNWYFTN